MDWERQAAANGPDFDHAPQGQRCSVGVEANFICQSLLCSSVEPAAQFGRIHLCLMRRATRLFDDSSAVTQPRTHDADCRGHVSLLV
jgi:hypothetical protein